MENIITASPYICAPNILDVPEYVAKTVELDLTGTDCIKAGSPISADGKVANDETAIGILLTDCHACLGARRGQVVIDGRIKQDVAAAHSGITISDSAKAALVNVSFTGDGSRMGGSLPKPIPYEYMPEGYPKVEMGDVTVYEGVDIPFEANGDTSATEHPIFAAEVKYNTPLQAGKKYTVVWDGTEYKDLEAFVDWMGRTIVGAEYGAYNNDLPFSIGSDGTLYISTWLTDTTHSVKVTTFGEIAEPINYKFMPDGYPQVETDVVLSAENVTFALNENTGAYASGNPISGNLVVGEKYTVVWDGVEYKDLVAFVDGYGFATVGAADEDSFTEEMPFMVVTVPGGCVPVTNSTAATHSITITHEKITPIAEKFLPYKQVVFYAQYGNLYWDSEHSKGVTAAEIRGLGYAQIVVVDEDQWFFATQVNDDGGEYITVITVWADPNFNPAMGRYYPVDYPASAN